MTKKGQVHGKAGLKNVPDRKGPSQLWAFSESVRSPLPIAENCEWERCSGVSVGVAVHRENNLPEPRFPPQQNSASACRLNDLHQQYQCWRFRVPSLSMLAA